MRASPSPAVAGLSVLLPAVLVFALAYDHGGYSLESRASWAIATWWVLALGAVLGWWPSRERSREATIVVALLTGFALLTLLSALWSTNDAGAFSDFFHMMFGDESAAAGEPEVFTTSGAESMDDLLSRLGMAGVGGAAGSARGGTVRGAGRSGQAAKPAPIEVTAELSLEEAFHGTSRIIELEGRRLEVTIPRGANTGSRIRLTGKGPGGRDLIVVTKLKPHRTFTRKADDLERDVPITLREALLGGEIPVATLKGRVLLTVPAGTQNERTFRLKGQGMPRFKGDGSGDLYVRVHVVLPTNLDAKAKAAAAKFLDAVDQPDPRT